MFLAKIQNFFGENKRNIFFVGAFFFFFFLNYQYGFAADTLQGQGSSDVGKFIEILGGGLKIVASLLGVLTAFVALFLNPEWTSGTAFGLQNHLKEIWILVSNVVYFIFALILIVIAIMNIANAGVKWELKQSLPRFIVGVLIVPFSWFFVQFIVSVSAILSIGILTLPYDTFKNEDFFTNINSDFKICVHQKIKLGSSDTNSTGNSGATGQFLECQEEKTIDEILNGSDGESGIKNGIFGIISIYTYGIMGVDGLDTINAGQLNSVKALLDLGVKGIFDLVFVIVYMLLMVALFLALFTRGVYLWMYMMLSPAFGLLYFFDKTKDGMGESGKSFNVKEFLSLALVPVYVSAALSFGLVFLFVAADGINKETTKTEKEETLDLVGLKLTIEGYQGKSEDGIFGGVQGALSTIIVEMFGIVILWIAVMAALKTSETTGSIIKPISDFGNSVGSLVKNAPMYAPIIPTGTGQMQSAYSLSSAGQSLTSSVTGDQSTRGTTFGQNLASSVGLGGNPELNAYKTAMASHAGVDAGSPLNSRSAALTTALTRIERDKLATDKASQQEFVKYLKQIFGDDKITPEVQGYVNNINSGNLEQQLSRIFQTIGDSQMNSKVFGSDRPTAAQVGSILTTGAAAVSPAADTPPATPSNVNLSITADQASKPETEVVAYIQGALGANKISRSDLDTQLQSAGITDGAKRSTIITQLGNLVEDTPS